jgi:glycine/D-amino acid oxidase-like deaminating enzyme
MQVAVLGGGLQGCCTALALAESGVRVTLFDRNEQLLSRAAVANEGKIHPAICMPAIPAFRPHER